MSTAIPYEIDDREISEEDDSSYQPVEDPISVAVGSKGFATRHVVDGCVERFEESKVSRFPERFDRFYWEPTQLLIDVIADSDAQELAESRKVKRCAFKEEWCHANDVAYVALPESLLDSVVKVRTHINAVLNPAAPAVGIAGGAGDGGDDGETREPVRKRGAVSRPKAV